MNSNTILAEYEAAKVAGRTDLDPRIGFYRILSVYEGRCHNKPAQMATANWKALDDDIYTETIFHVQLETFRIGCNTFDSDIITLREIEVESADWYPDFAHFCVRWQLIPLINPSIDFINEMVKKNNFKIEFDEEEEEYERNQLAEAEEEHRFLDDSDNFDDFTDY